jgi:aldehyde:ferredoxin oxidoreductase
MKDDDLPERFFAEEGSSNENIKIMPLDRQEFLSARSNYYRAREYGPRGIPEDTLMRKLGIEEYL